MTVLGQDVLTKAARRNKPLRAWLMQWVVIAENAQWRSVGDIRRAYPSADGVRLAGGTVVTVFNVKGNDYRLLTWIGYDDAVVEALEVVTHAEYDKELWKERY